MALVIALLCRKTDYGRLKYIENSETNAIGTSSNVDHHP